MDQEKILEKIISDFSEAIPSLEEFDLVEELAFLFIDHEFNLNIDCYLFKDYIIKSDTMNYVYGFLSSIDQKYVEEFDHALKTGKISFLQTPKKQNNKRKYELTASYQLQDSFDLIRYFFQYWMEKNAVMEQNSNYFIDTFTRLAEFLFQDYLESLEYKSKELYYYKMNQMIHTNVVVTNMIVELKLIELYKNNIPMTAEILREQLMKSHVFLEDETHVIEDIISRNQILLSVHKHDLYGILFASFIHQKMIKKPNLIKTFCYLIDHPEKISIEDFMKAIGVPLEKKKGKLRLSRTGYRLLKQSYLAELEESFVKIKVIF